MRTILFVLCLVSVALAQDGKPDDELVILRDQLRQVRGVAVRRGGVDTIEALRVIAERLVEIEQRVERLEKKP